MRQWVFDEFQRAHPRQIGELRRVRIVDIDEHSLRTISQWPWARSRLATLIDAVASRGALAVGLDILLTEADRQSPHLVADSYPGLPGALKRELKALKPSDEVFAEVAAGYDVVVARAGMGDPAIGAGRALRWPTVVLRGEGALPSLPAVWPGVLANVPAIEAVAQYAGIVNRYESRDGAVRRVPVVGRVGGKLAGSLALESIRRAAWEDAMTVFFDPEGVVGVRIGEDLIETAPDGAIIPYFAHDDAENRAARRVSAARLLMEPETYPETEFANQIVLIGVTGLGTVDAPPTPISPRVDGVELQAQFIEMLLDGTRLVRPAAALTYEAIALLLGVGLLIVVLPRLRPLAGFLLALFLGAGVVWLSYGQFTGARLLLDPSYPVAGLLVVYVAMLSSMLAEGLRQRRALNAALERERLDNARLSGELDAAREIQMGILPDPRNIEGLPENLEVFAMLEPAREVGGDLYDVFMLDEHRLFFVVGDVSGKGVPASLFMAISKALCRSVAMRVDGSAAAKISVTNDEISRENPAMLFVTAVAGVVDARTGALDFCIAGHDAPLLLRDGEEPFDLESPGGPPLCALDDFPYPAERYQLVPGDTLLLSTDGITEAMNVAGELYGRQRMVERLRNGEPGRTPETLVETLYRDVTEYRGEASPSDDLTVMAIRFRGT